MAAAPRMFKPDIALDETRPQPLDAGRKKPPADHLAARRTERRPNGITVAPNCDLALTVVREALYAFAGRSSNGWFGDATRLLKARDGDTPRRQGGRQGGYEVGQTSDG
jgi:hypothetical protein